jgi:hypothetical protein
MDVRPSSLVRRLRRAPALIAAALPAAAVAAVAAAGAPAARVQLMPIGEAWAANSVNATVFRNDPITTHADRQYAAYYNADGRVVLAARTLGDTRWETRVTDQTGNIQDAHNVISIIADGDGFLHVSWDHHGHPLRYARSRSPGSLELSPKAPMTGKNEGNVTYPQFFLLPDGDLVFLYRDGESGRGNLVLNRYDTEGRGWTQVQSNLVSGEGARNAYPQACVDVKGVIHLSWVWRETPDVATNHDLCYARSGDGGRTWTRSDGAAYTLPVTAATAEVAASIPQQHELINQTSMCADGEGRPMIATYFRPPGQQVVQYFIVRHDGGRWNTVQVSNRTRPFTLSGGGSKAIPISRPQVIARTKGGRTGVGVLFRDEERGSKVSMAHCENLAKGQWEVTDMTDFPVRFWEPSLDHVRWQRDGVLNLYVQVAGQGDAETLEKVEPQTAYVLEWKP